MDCRKDNKREDNKTEGNQETERDQDNNKKADEDGGCRKGFLSEERRKIAAMDRKQRLRYFKDYYLGPVLVISFIVLGILWFVYDAFFSRMNVLYTGALVGCQVTEEGKKYLTEGFLEAVGGRDGKDAVLLSEDLWIIFSEEDAEEYQAADSNIYVNIAAGDFDYMLIDGSAIAQYAMMDAFADLGEYVGRYQIPEEDVYMRDGKAIAIKLSEEAKQKAFITSLSGEVYLVIVDIGRNVSYEGLLMEYLLQAQ